MAKSKSSTKKNSSAKNRRSSSTGSRKNAPVRRTAKQEKEIALQKSFFQSELTAIVVIMLGCFLLLTDIGLLGSLGGFFLSVQRGLLGQGYFLLAAAILAAAIVNFKYKDSYFIVLKILSVFGLMIVLAAMIHLMLGDKLTTIGELYSECSEGGAGGGLIGGTLTILIRSVIGTFGAYILLIALLLVFGIIITEKSFVSVAKFGAEKTAVVMKAGAGKTVEAAKTGHEKYQQARLDNRQRREAQKAEEQARRELEYAENKRMSMSDITLAATGTAAVKESVIPMPKAETTQTTSIFGGTKENTSSSIYGAFGKDIIGDEAISREPAAKQMEVRSVPVQEKPKSVPVREIDYNSDEIPFEETKEDTYKSYAYILDKGVLSIDSAKQAGFAVRKNAYEAGDIHANDPAFMHEEEPVHIDAFKTRPDTYMTENAAHMEESERRREITINEGFVSEIAPEDLESIEYLNRNTPKPEDTYESFVAAATEQNTTANAWEDTFDKTGEELYTAPYEGVNEESSTESFDAADVHTVYDAAHEEAASIEEEVYVTATGKEMKAPDSYERDKILKDKLRTGQMSGNSMNRTGTQPAANAHTATETAKPAAPKPAPKPKPRPYVFPRVNLLDKGTKGTGSSRESLMNNARKLEKVLKDFGVGVTVTNVIVGPRVSRYELTPEAGVKVSKITSLTGDIKLALAAREIRIEAPIPGKSAVGIEVPNEQSSTVKFRDILESEEFQNAKSKLCWGIGLDIGGNTIVSDIAKMPHILVSGTTGSGKSVGINSLIMSILYRATPQEVKMILVDPKQVEFTVYNGIPHLLTPVVTTPEKALSALNWACAEMNRRYKLFQESGTRNIAGYNEKLAKVMTDIPEEERLEKLPYILIVIDELSELMMHAKKDVEACIVSLAQLARAAGLHLVVATQRPSVDVVTGLIKSNIPSRVAFKLPSVTDSRTILDSGGAESLLGNGDMLYKPGDKGSPIRVQGAFLSDDEVETVVNFVRQYNPSEQDAAVETEINKQMELNLAAQSKKEAPEEESSAFDEYFADAGRLIISSQKASIGGLQRKFKVGFNRAARIMDQLCECGVVSDGEGTKERKILMDMATFEDFLNS